jgi:hypothetical protein
MSVFWLTPAAPGTVAPAHLDAVRELHAAVRAWIESTARAQNIEHLLANLPYVDLMFAFGFATLGDHPTATKLTEDARKVLAVPIPEGTTPQEMQAVTAALVSNFLFKAFRYRVEQALNGQSLGGPLSAEVLADREALAPPGAMRPVNTPQKLAGFVIDRFREFGRILEPTERVDQYADWTKDGDAMKRELTELHAVRDPAVLAERIRKLYDHGVPGKPLKEVRFYLLHEGLPLAPRVSEAFTVELLALVPAALRDWTEAVPESPAPPKMQGELLESALSLAGHFGREDIVRQLIDSFTALVHSKPEGTRFRLINVVVRQCLWSLRKLGLANELDRLLTLLHGEVTDGAPVEELRTRHAAKPESWAAVLQTLLNLAGGWMQLGRPERAAPILAAARNELLGMNAIPLQPKDYTELARTYVTALGEGPADTGFPALVELFRKIDPLKISNTWTTAQYYSRFHLNLVEDTVFAVCRLGPDNAAPVIATA